jgi:uncharacterized protein (DUF1684 family)
MTTTRLRSLCLALAASAALVVLGACSSPPSPAPAQSDAAHRAEIEAWRAERDKELRDEDGWLTLAGLFWLEEGASTFGSASDNTVVFPAGQAPARLGTFHREGEKVTLEVTPGLGLKADGKEVTVPRLELAPDASGKPTLLSIGSLTFHVIRRPGKIGIRLKDKESAVLAGFTGVDSFAIDPSWRIEARFEPYDPPKKIKVPNIIGTDFDETSPGALVFERDGATYRLEPTGEPGDELFLVFGDATNGHQTYGGGRFLYVPAPKDGKAVVDFNKAYNPPCVFTPYATCPLPPRQNKLALRIEAGDKMWGEAH